MAKPYNLDLRIRVIENLESNNMTQREAADIFGLGLRTIKRWVKINEINGFYRTKKDFG